MSPATHVELFSFTQGRPNDGSDNILAPSHFFRCDQHNVLLDEDVMQGHTHLNLLGALGADEWHDDQKIDVRIRAGGARGHGSRRR